MPVTPRFTLRQDAEFVYCEVRVPYVRVSDLEYVLEGQELSFFVKPYLLRLRLPGNVVDDDRAKAVYDAEKDHGTVTLHLPKETRDEHFADLDLLTQLQQPRRVAPQAQGPLDYGKEAQLLNAMVGGADVSSAAPSPPPSPPPPPPSKERAAGPLIEVLSSTSFDAGATAQDDAETAPATAAPGAPSPAAASAPESAGASSTAAIAKLLESTSLSGPEAAPQALPGVPAAAPMQVGVSVSAPAYGFNDGQTGFFGDILNDFPELVDLPEPDATPETGRTALRLAAEDADFDKERFLGDFFAAEEDPLFQEAMRFEGHWARDEELPFSEEEQEQMRKLQNREFLPFSREQTDRALCAVYDVVLAFAYNELLTQGDPTVESAWTIRKLSATLSWLERFEDPQTVAEAALHRMLAYPYLRTPALATQVIQAGTAIFARGRRAILRSLLCVHRVLARSDQFYLLNRLYVTDMCVWVQQADEAAVEAFAARVASGSQRALAEPFAVVRWPLESLVRAAIDEEDAGDEGEQDNADAPPRGVTTGEMM